MGRLIRDKLPQRASQALHCRDHLCPGAVSHRGGSSWERLNSQQPPKSGSRNLTLSTCNQNLMPLGLRASGWRIANSFFGQTSCIHVLPYCRLARRHGIINAWVKVCLLQEAGRLPRVKATADVIISASREVHAYLTQWLSVQGWRWLPAATPHHSHSEPNVLRTDQHTLPFHSKQQQKRGGGWRSRVWIRWQLSHCLCKWKK